MHRTSTRGGERRIEMRKELAAAGDLPSQLLPKQVRLDLDQHEIAFAAKCLAIVPASCSRVDK